MSISTYKNRLNIRQIFQGNVFFLCNRWKWRRILCSSVGFEMYKIIDSLFIRFRLTTWMKPLYIHRSHKKEEKRALKATNFPLFEFCITHLRVFSLDANTYTRQTFSLEDSCTCTFVALLRPHIWELVVILRVEDNCRFRKVTDFSGFSLCDVRYSFVLSDFFNVNQILNFNIFLPKNGKFSNITQC